MVDVSEPGGVHAEIAVSPADACPFAALAGEFDLRQFVPGTPTGPAQVVVAEDGDADPVADASDVDGVEPVLAVDSRAVCRVDPDACEHDPCVGAGLGFLPVEPFRSRFRNGEVSCHLAAADDVEIRECVGALDEAGFDTRIRQLQAASMPGDGTVAVVDLDELTERQREVAAYAVECGYFAPDGPTAAAIADDLGISKSTLSAHLTAVRRKVGKQLFD